MAFTLISMEKFALHCEQIEIQARSRNELNSYVKVPLYYRKRLLWVAIDYAPGFASCHWIEEREATKSAARA